MRFVTRATLSTLALCAPLLAQHQGIPGAVPIDISTAFDPSHPASGLQSGTALPDDGLPGAALSPDGRLLLFAWRNLCDWRSGWYVSALRHEALTLDSQGLPRFTPPSGPPVWSPAWLVEFASRTTPVPPIRQLAPNANPPHPMWILQWVSMVPDPAFRNLPTPYTSDGLGNFVPPPSSSPPSYVTYRMQLVAADSFLVNAMGGAPTNLSNPNLPYTTSPCGSAPDIDPNVTSTRGVDPIGRRTLMVVVANPYTTQATVHGTSINNTLDVLYFDPSQPNAPEQPILGIEPTITLDGRLLVFQSSPNMMNANWSTTDAEIDRLMYSWNATPGATHHWSEPRPISELNAHAGDLVDGVPLSKRYPLAEHPLMEMDGTLFNIATSGAKPGIAGAYPWITLDGSDLTFASVDDAGARVVGVAMIGRSTHWRMRHIDGPLNPSRRGTGIAGSDAYHRRIMTGTGLAPGAWAWGSRGQTVLPYAPADRTFSVLSARALEYAEVPVDAGLDDDILLALDMNEAITGNGSLEEDWSIDTTRTPDTAKHGVLATLYNDASFPVPTNLPLPPAQDPIVYSGRIGECVTFTNTGVIAVPTIAELDQARSSETISMWVKNSASSSALGMRKVLEKGSACLIAMDGLGQVQFGVLEASWSITYSPPIATPASTQWTHLALVFDGAMGQVSLWIDGVQAPGSPFALAGPAPHQLQGNSSLLLLGPNGSAPSGNTVMLSIDQLRIDGVVRDPDEIRRLAHIPSVQPPSSPLPSWFSTALTSIGRDPSGLSLPQGSVLTQNIVLLGEKLFADPNLSQPGLNRSCATCHQPTTNFDFTDGLAQRLGLSGQVKLRNAPTVIDRLWGHTQFWDGRGGGVDRHVVFPFDSLEQQVPFPINNPEEMNSSISQVVAYLNQPGSGGSPDYLTLFGQAYTSQPTASTFQSAIASYERALVSLPSRANAYEGGQSTALNSTELQGRNLFFGKARCFACHNGPNLSDEQFHVTVSTDPSDIGRGNATGRLRQNFRFKTPALRHLSVTGPYFHNGSAATLTDVISAYVRGGDLPTARDEEILPLDLTDQEASALEAYLGALESTWTRL
jgi:cytochrome c peroxidase